MISHLEFDCIFPKSVSVGLIKSNSLFKGTRYINTKFNFTIASSSNLNLTNQLITFLDEFSYLTIKWSFTIILKLCNGFSNFNGILLFDFSKKNPISRFIFPENFDIPSFSCDHRTLTAWQGFYNALVKRNSNLFFTSEVFYLFNNSIVPYIGIGHVEQVSRDDINRVSLNPTIGSF